MTFRSFALAAALAALFAIPSAADVPPVNPIDPNMPAAPVDTVWLDDVAADADPYSKVLLDHLGGDHLVLAEVDYTCPEDRGLRCWAYNEITDDWVLMTWWGGNAEGLHVDGPTPQGGATVTWYLHVDPNSEWGRSIKANDGVHVSVELVKLHTHEVVASDSLWVAVDPNIDP